LSTLKDAVNGQSPTIAYNHVQAVGLDYRVISDTISEWWRPGDSVPAQGEMDV
jgi:hypothetical protein